MIIIYMTLPITFPIFICTLSLVKFTANKTNVSHADVVPLFARSGSSEGNNILCYKII